MGDSGYSPYTYNFIDKVNDEIYDFPEVLTPGSLFGLALSVASIS